ncbi:DUF488 domain-containing protein [Actinoplanes sp. NPDC049802]|uniref:DUF488 domain-containing protein n=1 Tax=Actinoplanes sp. NPDC049802 TaxID=3154742 RepID=UPI0033EC3EEA
MLAQPQARQALEDVAAAGRQERVAVLCFEADEDHCHRQVLIEEVQRRLGAGTDHRPQRQDSCR